MLTVSINDGGNILKQKPSTNQVERKKEFSGRGRNVCVMIDCQKTLNTIEIQLIKKLSSSSKTRQQERSGEKVKEHTGIDNSSNSSGRRRRGKKSKRICGHLLRRRERESERVKESDRMRE